VSAFENAPAKIQNDLLSNKATAERFLHFNVFRSQGIIHLYVKIPKKQWDNDLHLQQYHAAHEYTLQ
jgi:hypothetical protein